MKPYTLPTLLVRGFPDGDRICCARCGQSLGPTGSSWKSAAILREIPTDSLSFEPNSGEPGETLLRQFICQECGCLLDAETALSGEPFLEDVIIND
jgi:acetone carboxylase gamma subunit